MCAAVDRKGEDGKRKNPMSGLELAVGCQKCSAKGVSECPEVKRNSERSRCEGKQGDEVAGAPFFSGRTHHMPGRSC